jgi:hypothetical protein
LEGRKEGSISSVQPQGLRVLCTGLIGAITGRETVNGVRIAPERCTVLEKASVAFALIFACIEHIKVVRFCEAMHVNSLLWRLDETRIGRNSQSLAIFLSGTVMLQAGA